MSAKDRRQLIEGLRAVADFYESNAGAYYDGMTVVLRMFLSGRDAAQELASMADAFGNWQDISSGPYLAIARDFGSKVRVELHCPRPTVALHLGLSVPVGAACLILAGKRTAVPPSFVRVQCWLPAILHRWRKQP